MFIELCARFLARDFPGRVRGKSVGPNGNGGDHRRGADWRVDRPGAAFREAGDASRGGGARSPERSRQARAAGIIDQATTELEEGVAGAEVVVVCTPVSRIGHDVRRAAEAVPARCACHRCRQHQEADRRDRRGPPGRSRRLRRRPSDRRIGTLGLGPCTGRPAPQPRLRAHSHPSHPRDRLDRARVFWSRLGCRIVEMSPIEHDEVLAFTSHLPHALAAALTLSVPIDWQALRGRRLPRRHPCCRVRYRALDGNLPREPRAAPQGAGDPGERGSPISSTLS